MTIIMYMSIRKYCIIIALTNNLLAFSAHAEEAFNTLQKVSQIIGICSTGRQTMGQSIYFLKKEVPFHTSLPIEEGSNWIHKALMNEKISLSYDNLASVRNVIDLDCKTANYITSLLPKVQAGGPIKEDATVIDETFHQLTTNVRDWKKEYITFWQTLTETIHQYQENTKASQSPAGSTSPSIPAQ